MNIFVPYRDLSFIIWKRQQKATGLKKRNEETFDREQSGLRHIARTRATQNLRIGTGEPESNHKFRTVNIPKLHTASPYRTSFVFLLFLLPEPTAIEKVKEIIRYE